ncbi:hypothetical protein E6R60_26700 [Streptomyces sp. A0642]|uniref:hypothetical protein n=1 Tax=Streptomyces sp. A0642 TaxID=2563100 RepID=UPI0010A29982|nr:hypothetical protein [Streptomyces sp. A0642]THA72521.1 hypothetical protein E6R60_26700 [Streptomyces sp. A0642]
MSERTYALRLGTASTVRGVLGQDVVLREVERKPHQGLGRSDLVRCHAFIGSAYIGEVDSFWVLREDQTRSKEKEFAGTYPGAKDWGPSGRRADVIEDLVRHHLDAERQALDRELANLEQEKEAALRQVFAVQKEIDAAAARRNAVAAALNCTT